MEFLDSTNCANVIISDADAEEVIMMLVLSVHTCNHKAFIQGVFNSQFNTRHDILCLASPVISQIDVIPRQLQLKFMKEKCKFTSATVNVSNKLTNLSNYFVNFNQRR